MNENKTEILSQNQLHNYPESAQTAQTDSIVVLLPFFWNKAKCFKQVLNCRLTYQARSRFAAGSIVKTGSLKLAKKIGEKREIPRK